MKKKSYKIIAAGLAIVLGCMGISDGDLWAKSSKKELQQEQKELESLNQKMQKEVQELDSKMSKADEKYEKYQTKLTTIQKKKTATEKKLKEAKESKEEQYRIMKKRIKFLYENGNTAYLEIILEAKSLQEFLNRAEYVSKISEYDSTMFQKLKKTEAKITKNAEDLAAQEQEVTQLTAQAKKEKENLESVASEKKAKIEEYQQKMAKNQELLAEYEAAEQEAAQQEASASSGNSDSGSGGSSGSTQSSGSLLWPVPSCHSISSGYGYRIHPVTGERKLHAGIDIPCGVGSTIVAAESGTVVDAGYNAYNGNYLKISHGNGLETMYLHCSRLLVSSGSRVSRGQTIAKSGATGMVSGAHLHFVVKKNGNYVNPSNYL